MRSDKSFSVGSILIMTGLALFTMQRREQA